MKKILLILTVISLNAVLQSCTKESVASTDALYNTQASEDAEINQDPDEPDEPETPKNGE
ncbi:hypothetical protein [Galbibacter orientalis]|uniref:hypothetical protein n=1 Tax=Galbibacter orientalis TaxID=453852 RepID=UPI003080AFB5